MSWKGSSFSSLISSPHILSYLRGLLTVRFRFSRLVFTTLLHETPNHRLPRTQPYLQSGDGPIVLVLAPTRELALQIKQECDKFGASSEIKNTVVYGGVPKSTQVRDLRYYNIMRTYNDISILLTNPTSLFPLKEMV